ncbi:PAS domain S-box protein [Candidatus Deferrimicrobium sp.]|uniref:PAS domain S-box protein n=1 Tax=Candidatus Deferrimicrobium sp. TaxID=3060586 RepID=UPI002ED82FD8
MKRFSLLQRFSLLGLAAFLMAGIAIGGILTSSVEKSAVDRAKNETARFVASEVDRVFRGMDFRLPMTGTRYEDFQRRVPHLFFNPSIRRIKVWNLESVIVWSDERRLVGEQFPNNKGLLKALNGNVSSEIVSTDKPETRTERQYRRLLELYVPIRSEHEGKIEAVFEIYQDLDYLDAATARLKRTLWISIFAGFFGIYCACLGIVWRASRRLAEQTLEIGKSEEKNRALAQELTSLINNVPGIVYRGYRDWSLSFIGAEVEPVTGYTPDSFTSGAVAWKEIIHPDDLEQVKEAFRKAEKEKAGTLRVEYRIRNKDGGIRWIADRRQLIYGESGALAEVDGLLLDITERKETYGRIQESHDRFRALADTAPDGIITLDGQGTIAFINRAGERQFGYTHGEVIGKNITILIPERYRSAHQAGMERFLRTRDPRIIGNTVELEGLRKEGSEFPIELSLSTWAAKEGPFFSAVIRDITERRNWERSLKESEEQLRVIFEGSKDGILLADVESRKFHTGNKTICDMLQYSLDEIRHLGVSDIHPEEDLPRILEGFDRQARQEIEMATDIPVKRKDGSILFVDIKTSLITVSGKSYLMGNFRDATERKRTEEGLTRLGMAVDQAAEGIVITDAEGSIEYVNPSFVRITGYPLEDAVGRNMRFLKSGKHDESFYRNMWETISRGDVWRGRFINRKKDRTLYEEEAVISPVRNASGKIVHFVAGKRDITRDVMLQKQVQTAQRMDSVGTLAGGIAHDFNNALTGIMGVAEILRLKVRENPEVLRNLDLLDACARQAATLTRQLLTFARRQVIEPVNLDLNVVVSEMVKLVGKVIGEHIEVKTFLDKGLPTTRLDRGQVEQVIMNLCLNARDAMPSGGRLLLQTADVTVDSEYVNTHPYVTPGRYARLTVSDTGTGMDKETIGKVFEPFFTTKPVGQGTGLGLSSVYGIVKQSGGFIHAYSEPGNGSSFKVNFPAVEAPPDVVPGKRREEAVRGGTETILLAEDEGSLRALAERILTGLGYTVLIARDGEEAVDVLVRNVKVDLAVLDVVMPRMGGKEAYEKMRKGNPNLKALFMSGYSAEAGHESFVLNPGTPFLPKPYTPSTLARKVREVLDTR